MTLRNSAHQTLILLTALFLVIAYAHGKAELDPSHLTDSLLTNESAYPKDTTSGTYPKNFDNPLLEGDADSVGSTSNAKRKKGSLAPAASNSSKIGPRITTTEPSESEANLHENATKEPPLRGPSAREASTKASAVRSEDKRKFQEAFPEFTPLQKEKETEKKPKETPLKGKISSSIIEVKHEEKPHLLSDTDTLLINFRNINIVELINFISRQSGKNFVFDEDELNFKVTIISEEPTTIRDVLTTLMQVLQIRGLSMIEEDNNIIIHANPNVHSPAKVITDQTKDLNRDDAQIITRVFQLSSIMDPVKLADVIRPLVSPQAIVEPIEKSNHLIVTDLNANIKKITKIIKAIDSPQNNFTIAQYTAKQALIGNLVVLAEKILAPIAQDKTLLLVPKVSSNKAFIVSNPALVEQALTVLKELDVADSKEEITSLGNLRKKLEEAERARNLEEVYVRDPKTGKLVKKLRKRSDAPEDEKTSADKMQFFLHRLQYRTGKEIADALQKVAETMQTTEGASNDLANAINTVQWIETTNTLIFSGTVSALRKIQQLIKEIDSPVKQVFIEVLMLDTTITDALSYGVEWGSRFDQTHAAGEQVFVSANNREDPVNSLSTATVTPRNNFAKGFELGVIGRTIIKGTTQFANLAAIVKASHEDKVSRVLHNPKIIVEDNKMATFFAGENTAFRTNAITNQVGNFVTSNYEFRDIGTTLKVTPHISNNNLITLDIDQEFSQTATIQQGGVSGTVTNAANGSLADAGPTTVKSTAKTTIHVPNNYFVVLSGYVRDELDEDRNQIPCLGGIPVAGAAFSQKTRQKSSRVVLMFIRPHIVETEEEIDYTTKRQQDIYNDFTDNGDRWHLEVEEALDWMNIDKNIHKPKTYHGSPRQSPCDKGACPGPCDTKERTW